MNYVLIAYKLSIEGTGKMAVMVMQPNFLPQYLLVHASVKSNIKEAVIMMSEEKVVLLQLPCSLPSVMGQEEFKCVLCADELFFKCLLFAAL